MKTIREKSIWMILAASALILSGCGSTGTSTDSGFADIFTSAPSKVYKAVYPTSPDMYEGDTGDNNMSTASAISVGEPLQGRSIFPQGDYDWVKVDLEAGTIYDLFAVNLNEKGDTYLYIYDMNGVELNRNDDYIDYDSYIEFNATYTGTFYLKVRSYSVREATSYQLGVRVHVDADNDGYSEPYDCNDNNNTIYPFATEIPGDGVDQDCSGVDALAANVSDRFEVDNDMSSAKPIPVTEGSYSEIEYRYDIFSQMHTLHDIQDSDYMIFTIPPYSKVSTFIPYRDINGSYSIEYYDENGTLLSTSPYRNTTNVSQTYYMVVSSTGGTGWYVPTLIPAGEDRDGDGYYTKDWSMDCNDANASIHPGANDSNNTDGIDMNCDGIDGVNSTYTY